MAPPRSDALSASRIHRRQTAAASQSGGCLSGYLMPPLAALTVGLLLAMLSSRLTVASETRTSEPPLTRSAPVQPSGLASLFTPEVQWWSERILAWASDSGLDANLIATVMQIESCGDARARSRAGAMGLFQVMPYHFYGMDDPYDPETNARRGLAYLRKSLDAANGDVRLALAGYNGGIGVISRAESFWAAETIRYVYWGTGIHQDAAQGTAHSERLQEWLGRGGASLCRQARQRLGIP